jgi:hypothetical protein
VRRREEDLAVVVEEVAAGGLPTSGRHPAQIAAVETNGVLLVAAPPIARRLKDQSPSVATEIRLGVLAAVRQLADIGEMAFGGFRVPGSEFRVQVFRNLERRTRNLERRTRNLEPGTSNSGTRNLERGTWN